MARGAKQAPVQGTARRALVFAGLALALLAAWWLRSKPANDAIAQGWQLAGRQAALAGETMGTSYRVVVVDLELAEARDVAEAIRGALAEVDSTMSTYDPESELSRFNRAAGAEPITVSPPLREVLEQSRRVATESDGAFDPSVGPLVDAWGFGPQLVGAPPTAQEIERLRAHCGLALWSLDEAGLVKADPELRLDLSAIAKGYGVDQVAVALRERGITDYLVEVGGEVRSLGSNPSGQPWRVGIERPSDDATGGRAIHQIVLLAGESMATSGDYRNYREEGGVRFSHTIDPRTGRPITPALASVSVIHSEASLADAYATAINVLGPDAGLALAEKLELPVYLLVRQEGGFEPRWTSGFARYMPEDAGVTAE